MPEQLQPQICTNGHSKPAAAGNWWALPLLLGLGISVFSYLILPSYGVYSLAYSLSLKKMFALVVAVIAGYFYWQYLRVVFTRPHWLVFYMAVFWPFVNYMNLELLAYGVNLHMRPLLLMVLGVPCAWYLVQDVKQLFRQLPHFKYYVLFMLRIVVYFVGYNLFLEMSCF